MTSEDEEAIEKTLLCNNVECVLKIACARFWDPIRTENVRQESGELHKYTPDECYIQRRQLQGTPEIFRKMKRTTKRHRRSGGEWI